MIEKMGNFGGDVLLFGGCVGAPEGPGWGNYPFQLWMGQFDKEKYGWCGYLWLHDITLLTILENTKNDFFLEYTCFMSKSKFAQEMKK